MAESEFAELASLNHSFDTGRMNLLFDALMRISAGRDCQATVEELEAQAKWFLDFDSCSVGLVNAAGCETFYSMPAPGEGQCCSAIDRDLVLRVLESRQFLNETDESHGGQVMGLPCVVDEACIGAVLFRANSAGTFHESDFRYARMTVAFFALAIDRLRRNEEIVAARREVEDANRSLECRVAERTQELTVANDRLVRSNQELQEFAYVASHDLQEPLRKMSAYAQILLDEYGEQLNGEGREYVEIVVDGASRLKHLVQDLLAFSRINRQGRKLAPVSAKTCVEMALSNLELLLEESRAQVSCCELPVVEADESQLVALFQNLINNAVKYCDDDPVIQIGGRRVEDNFFEFCVRDNGIGIAPRYHERIFGIFKRLHSRKEYSGTGIGLANCRRIVERFGGRIWVESVEGRGSAFYFTIKNSNQRPVT